MTTTPAPLSPEATRARAAIYNVAIVAVLAAGLGMSMHALVGVLRLADGVILSEALVIAGLVGSVAWSVVVCTGVAIAMSIGKARTVLVGALAVLFAPVALAAAKAAEKVMLAVMDAAGQPALLSIGTVGVVRALEYGLLAMILTMLTERRAVRFMPYATAGLAVGVAFGGLLAGLTLLAGAPATPADVAVLLVKEIGSPLGCALVIFVGQMVTRSFRVYGRSSRRARPVEA